MISVLGGLVLMMLIHIARDQGSIPTEAQNFFRSVADPAARLGGGARNMKSMQLNSAAIFFMTYFYRTRALAPPSTWIRYCRLLVVTYLIHCCIKFTKASRCTDNSAQTHLTIFYLSHTSYANAFNYRSGTVNSKSFIGKVLLRIKWKFELN